MANDVVQVKEALVALVKLGKFIAKQGQDGFQISDALALANALIGDEVFRSAILDGFSGASQIPTEIRDLSFEEGMELAAAIVEELKLP